MSSRSFRLGKELARNLRGAATYAGLRVTLPVVYQKADLPRLLDALAGADARTDARAARAERHATTQAVGDPHALSDVCTATERLVARLPFVPSTCLYRSLARFTVLRRAGHPAVLVLGVRPGERDLEGHAWVELHGEVLGESPPEFVRSFMYPAAAGARASTAVGAE